MQKEKEAQCLLGNGVCPKKCKLYGNAVEITAELGDKFDPVESRRMILFADIFNHDITLAQIETVILSCATEPRPIKEQRKNID